MMVLDSSDDHCHLFTDVFGRMLQLLLACIAIFMLYIKRKLEFPIRPIKVWAMDVSKQSLGALYIHSVSVILSIVLVAASTENYDECGIYFVNYVLDTTWGGFIMIVFLRMIDNVAARFGLLDIARCGDYGDPPQMRIWWTQFFAYLLALTLMKIVDVLILWTFLPDIAYFATRLFSAFKHHRHLELSLVMLVIPGCCTSAQFWIVDSYLKSDDKQLKFMPAIADDNEKRWISQDVVVGLPPPPLSQGDESVKSVSPL
ncbi:hypothetical protein JG687_00005667 [Phytophthora cactorum]|uniref:Store-operated calcium entry regulator STIMATE n=1 Tax=Phytophthora cactorum TaxID=29920 RepID=A0A8T1UMH4_9STRA|nr:hypothetical protein PC120_g9273 [Phytophthora cactorum]KAG3102664.1 hypothetical protein PC121_g1178 [Phytophthora cactorum]KAG3183256.1 hypothetical protein PC128_g14284 [Phytophthora cactorum]KAG4056157.1 hypothetical protein PC123_g8775 [Phytophthora cactorum]KAG6964957.1 hypothetical protein JG687_00005667 [Phytophthora cactorum]